MDAIWIDGSNMRGSGVVEVGGEAECVPNSYAIIWARPNDEYAVDKSKASQGPTIAAKAEDGRTNHRPNVRVVTVCFE